MLASRSSAVFAGLFLGVLIVVVVLGVFIGGPLTWKSTKVWRLEQDGKAKLAEAVSSKQVQIESAKGDFEASKLNARAEVERAKGTAKAVKIENGAITDSYTKYLFVKNLGKKHEGKEIIYVPTEAGLPVLEAGKR